MKKMFLLFLLPLCISNCTQNEDIPDFEKKSQNLDDFNPTQSVVFGL